MNALTTRVDNYVLKRIGRYACLSCWVVMIALTLSLIVFLASPAPAQTSEPKRVLVLLENDVSWPAFRLMDENARAVLRAGSPEGIQIFSEHLDRVHFPDPGTQAQQTAWIKQKYANSHLDLVISVGDVPADLFPGVPLVFMSADPFRKPPDSVATAKNAGSVWADIDAEQTLELAQRLQPRARRIFVIGDGLPPEDTTLTRLQRVHPASAGGMPITYVMNPVVPEICQTVSKLGTDSIVLFIALTRDEHGHPLIPAEVIAKIAAASGAPVYAIFDSYMGTGALGGYVTSFAEVGKAGGQQGLRILAGEHPRDVLVPNVYLFDWRQLRRWKIPESTLPSESVVLFRQPSLWESYKYYVLGGVLLCVVETLLILGLLWQRANRRKFEQSLLERMAFEKMLSDLSATFIDLAEEQVGVTIEKSLGGVAKFLSLDRITLFGYSQECKELRVNSSWRSEEVQPVPAVLQAKQFSWMTNRLLCGETVLAEDLDSLPAEASEEREFLRRLGAISVVTVPLKAGGQLFGALSFSSAKRRVSWTDGLVEQLKLLAEIFSNALMRQGASDARFRHAAILESSDDAIISENLDGIIVSWNAAAQRLFGFSEAEAIGQPITILIPDELCHEEDKFLQSLTAGERVEHYETVRIAKGGKRVAVSLTISPVRDSERRIVGFSKIARDITDRKRAEQVLRESEERFRLVANGAPVLIWMSGTDKLCNFFNQGWLNFTGRSIEEELGDGWISGVHPDDVQSCHRIYSESFDSRSDFEMEYRLRRFDREYRWIVDYGVPRFESDGTFCGYIGTCVDITERKILAESLQALTGRLISAHDEERARIARDLHDDFSQRLALQCIDLEQLGKKLPELEVDARNCLLKILKGTKAMSADIRSLSHELHSSKLEFVGLVPALSSFCDEIGEKYKIAVHFTRPEVHFNIPKEVALCLFRVTQEGLSNVVKHSQAKSVQVELLAKANLVSLRIKDEGNGFDPGRTGLGAGLGLLGMTERLRLVGGKLTITSELAKGTVVLAEVRLFISEGDGYARAMTAGGRES
jgi:PAS domain S-box-containing protein